MANISAIVPATNRPETLAQCEAALRRSDSPPDEILLVDEPADANAAAARNLGTRRAAAAVVASVAAVPVGVLLHVLDRPRRRR
jgi:GT2 family glycosyltransferase